MVGAVKQLRVFTLEGLTTDPVALGMDINSCLFNDVDLP